MLQNNDILLEFVRKIQNGEIVVRHQINGEMILKAVTTDAFFVYSKEATEGSANWISLREFIFTSDNQDGDE